MCLDAASPKKRAAARGVASVRPGRGPLGPPAAVGPQAHASGAESAGCSAARLLTCKKRAGARRPMTCQS